MSVQIVGLTLYHGPEFHDELGPLLIKKLCTTRMVSDRKKVTPNKLFKKKQ